MQSQNSSDAAQFQKRPGPQNLFYFQFLWFPAATPPLFSYDVTACARASERGEKRAHLTIAKPGPRLKEKKLAAAKKKKKKWERFSLGK